MLLKVDLGVRAGVAAGQGVLEQRRSGDGPAEVLQFARPAASGMSVLELPAGEILGTLIRHLFVRYLVLRRRGCHLLKSRRVGLHHGLVLSKSEGR
jgi:hypothetical protein